jgi:hypothetical protein
MSLDKTWFKILQTELIKKTKECISLLDLVIGQDPKAFRWRAELASSTAPELTAHPSRRQWKQMLGTGVILSIGHLEKFLLPEMTLR